MADFISIPSQLRNYLEMLFYEKVRYNDLLASVKRDATSMTDEEWNSSWEYYTDLRDEAHTMFAIAMDEVSDMYRKEIAGKPWEIDFKKSKICINGYVDDTYNEFEYEQYTDQLCRLYPLPPGEAMSIHINNKRAKNVTLQVTDDCNMACTYCYQHNKKHHSMSFENAKKFLDMILDSDEMTNTYITTADCNGIVIEYIGGEPWLEIDLIEKASDYFIAELFRRKHPLAIKFSFNVCSNGLLHFDERVQRYLRNHALHMFYSVTIDGNKKLHDSCRVDLGGKGTYDRAMAAVIDYETKLNTKIGSKLTISPDNIYYLNDAVRHMIEYGYRRINLNCVYEEGWTYEHATELYNQLVGLTDWLFESGLETKTSFSIFTTMCGKPLTDETNGNWCGGTGNMLAVDYKGDMYPCLRYMESSLGDNQPAYIIGNLKDGLNRTPEHKERVDCLNCITRRSQSTDECYNCPIAEGCAWCSGYNYELYGTANKRATFICCMHKARVLANVYYWRRRGEDFPLNVPKEWALEIISEEEYEKLKAM